MAQNTPKPRRERSQYNREWRLNNLDRAAAASRAWRERHPDKVKEAHAKTVRWRATGAAQKQKYLATLKLERGCIDCGYKGHYAALEFDHVRGVKVKALSRMAVANASWEALEAEIAKCEVRCSNCHRIRTHEQRLLQRSMTSILDNPAIN